MVTPKCDSGCGTIVAGYGDLCPGCEDPYTDMDAEIDHLIYVGDRADAEFLALGG